jgi:hypothetical protein
MAGDSEIKGEIIELAERAKDESLSPKDRLIAMMELGHVVNTFESIQTMLDELNKLSPEELDAELNKLEEDNEPKYVWKNGARVKVK